MATKAGRALALPVIAITVTKLAAVECRKKAVEARRTLSRLVRALGRYLHRSADV